MEKGNSVLGLTNPLERIMQYFSQIAEKNRAARSERDDAYQNHIRKSSYIDSLHLTFEEIFEGRKAVISDNNEKDGYYVAIGERISGEKKESIIPNLTIFLDSTSIDKMIITLYNRYLNEKLLQYEIRNDDDFKNTKERICDYVNILFGCEQKVN